MSARLRRIDKRKIKRRGMAEKIAEVRELQNKGEFSRRVGLSVEMLRNKHKRLMIIELGNLHEQNYPLYIKRPFLKP